VNISRGSIERRPARQPAVAHPRNAIERERGFRDRRGQHDPPAAVRIAPDGSPLPGRLALPVKRQDGHARQAFLQPFLHPLDLAHAGQEGQHIAFLLAPRGKDGRRHGLLHPQLRAAAQPFDAQRMGLAFAFHHRRIAQKPGEARAVYGGGHHQQPQILAQHLLAFDRQGEAEIAVQMPLMRFVEQHGRNPGQFGITEYLRDEDGLRHHQDARFPRSPAVQPGEITHRLARLFPQQFGHPLGGVARCHPARGKQDDGALAPLFPQQGGRDRSRLARARRSDQHGRAALPQGGEQVRQHGIDGEIGHASPISSLRT